MDKPKLDDLRHVSDCHMVWAARLSAHAEFGALVIQYRHTYQQR